MSGSELADRLVLLDGDGQGCLEERLVRGHTDQPKNVGNMGRCNR